MRVAGVVSNGAIARHRRGLFLAGLFLADIVLIILAFFVADYARYHLLPPAGPLPHMPHDVMLRPALLAIVAFLPALWSVGLYEMRRGWSILDLMFSVCVGSSLGVMCFLALSYLLKEFWYSRLMVWIFAAVVWIGLIGLRTVVKHILLWCFRRGIGVLRVVVVGDSPVARTLVSRIQRNGHSGLRIVGHLVASEGGERGQGEGIGRLEEAFESMRRAGPHICLFAEPIHGREEMTLLLARCQEEGMRVWLGTDLHQRYSSCMELKEVESIPVIVVGGLRLATWERLLKRAMDVVGAAILLILAAPFLLYAAIRIRREIGTPVIFRQTRVGFQGRPFTILKIRSVPVGALEPQQREGAAGIRFCDFLRAYSLDELPQLWSVLRGDMSLVGPRPETPERVRRYNLWNRRRLQVKPGITGLAQVAGVRGDHDFDIKSRFDVRYLESQSLLLDLQILLRTPLVVWRRRLRGRGIRPAPPVSAWAAAPGAAPHASQEAVLAEALPPVGRYGSSASEPASAGRAES